jgi:hypothetical protein
MTSSAATYLSVDRDRIAYLHCWSHAEMMLHLNVLPMRFVAATFNPRSLALRAVIIPKAILAILAVAVGISSMIQVYRIGDAGSRSVWAGESPR